MLLLPLCQWSAINFGMIRLSWKLKRDQALRDRDVLRTSIAALVTGPSFSSSSRPIATASSTSACVKRPSTFALTPPPRTKSVIIKANSQSVVKVTPKTHSPTASGTVAEPSPPCKTPKNNPSRSPHSSTRSHAKLMPKTPALPGPDVRKGKGRARNPTPAPASSDDDDSSDAGPRTLAALSRSRSSSRRKFPLGNPTTPSSTLPELMVVDTSSSDVDSPTSPVVAPLRPKPKVYKVDLFGKASISSEGPISVTEDVRAPANNLLSSAESKDLPKTKVPRDQWIPGYHCRVPKSSVQVSPWSARRVSWISVLELDLEFFYRHLARPKHYPFPASPAVSKAPPMSEWSPHLISSARVAALYRQEPWKSLRVKIAPIPARWVVRAVAGPIPLFRRALYPDVVGINPYLAHFFRRSG
uniref:Uncharacterized protein n=1 Tax=Peronospora matthiolae TaxID=2874970 RepID=A0AAV1UDA5_9STRA